VIKVITHKDLIEEIVGDFGGEYSKKEVTDILNQLEYNIVNHLKSASEQQSILIKLFFGLQITSRILEKQEVDFNGRTFERCKRIHPKAKFTRYFRRCILNELDT
jgi:CBS domain containing-hemolysin-like protein